MSSIVNINDISHDRTSSKKKRKRMHCDSENDKRMNTYTYKSNCGLLRFRPKFMRRLATIQMFVFASCILVTLQQALSSGYFNSVLTTIEKRFDVPSKLMGTLVSTFEIGNLITIIFVSYFGTNRHIPVWIGKGILITGIGSLIFAISHFMHDIKPALKINTDSLDDNLCHMPKEVMNQNPSLEIASYLLNVISPENDPRFCNEKGSYRGPQLIVFILGMVLIGSGATPIFTLGTIYIDDHTLTEDSSMYIGCMYSMVAFGLMVGYLLGGYFITIHENSFGSGDIPANAYYGSPRFAGCWWVGFVILGVLLILISIVFFMFPRSLKMDKKRKKMAELKNSLDQCITITSEQCSQNENQLTQLNGQTRKLLCNCSSNKCSNECTSNNEKSISVLPNYLNSSSNSSNIMMDQQKTNLSTIANNNFVSSCKNSNLVTSTATTKLQLSIAPTTKRHHRHHSLQEKSASAMINCTSNFFLGDQTFTTSAAQPMILEPILRNAAIKLGHQNHKRSISTSIIHHHHHLHLHHLHNANNQFQHQQLQLQDKPILVKPIEDELKDEHRKFINEDCTENLIDSCSIVSSTCPIERKLKDIPACMWSLLTNPVYITTCLGSCMELCIVSGFLVFLPKYLETQFSISKSQANLITGSIVVPGACIGIFLGGYLLKKLSPKPKDAIQFVLFFNLICMGLYTALYFLGCDNPKMAGTTLPYFNSSHADVFQVNLNSDCNRGCQCSPNDIEPVCGSNNITYFSPCHAGCLSVLGQPKNGQDTFYGNCSCIKSHWPMDNTIDQPPSIAHTGFCNNCKTMVPFLILLFVATLVVSISQMPLVMVILRSVREDERAFALGMQFVLFRLFGYIPSPILFGQVIDSSCLLWKANCGQKVGFCLIYNIEHFRLRYVGLCSALKVFAGLLFFFDFFLISYRQRNDLNQPVRVTIDEVVNSIYNLDQEISVSRTNKTTNCDKKNDDSDTELHTLNTNQNHDSDYNSNNSISNDEDELK